MLPGLRLVSEGVMAMAWKHGYSGYVNYGCRCDVCREGNRVTHAAYLERHPEQRQKARQREILKRHSLGLEGLIPCPECGQRTTPQGMPIHRGLIHDDWVEHPHGTVRRYASCKGGLYGACGPCKDAAAAYKRERRARGLAN